VTPSRWTLLSPWWVRWLAGGVATAATLAAVTAMMWPTFLPSSDWAAKAAAIGISGLAIASALLYAQQPWRQAYIATLRGLDRSQQGQALQALRRGEMPPDPAVLAGAIRAGALSTAYRNAITKSQKATRWWMPALYLVISALQWPTHELRKGLLWLGFALFFAGYFASVSYRERRLQHHVELLRAGAAGIGEAEAAVAETAGGVPRPPQRQWATAVLLGVIAACFIATVSIWGPSHSGRPPGDCAVSREVVEFLDRHREMLDARGIAPGGPGLDAYQEWSDQLRTFAEQVTAPDLSAHLTRVAALSARAVAVVRDLRSGGGTTTPPEVIQTHENDYMKIISELNSEEGDATAVCNGRR
jgi:hypothetical protein